MVSASNIFLYDDRASKSVRICEVKDFIQQFLKGTAIEVRGEFFDFFMNNLTTEEKEKVIESTARKFATIKVRNIAQNRSFAEPIYGEIQYEMRRLMNEEVKATGILYDGFELQNIFAEFIPNKERNLKSIHIVFTNQLFGTYDDDHRYHYRTSIYGILSVISTTGIVEAPAKPREYYIEKQALTGLGAQHNTIEKLKEKYKGRFIDIDDERLTEVIKGYAMQAVFMNLSGHPFCEDPDCRLFNAHWQSELIHAQLEGSDFCDFHAKMLKNL